MAKTILLIDDERDFTELTSTLFSFHGFTVDTFNEPTLVEQSVQQKQYHVIITDLMMPGMDGFALIKMIRGLPNYQTTPIIALSAKVLTDEERKFLLQKKVQVITKPFEPNSLVEEVSHLLGTKES